MLGGRADGGRGAAAVEVGLAGGRCGRGSTATYGRLGPF